MNREFNFSPVLSVLLMVGVTVVLAVVLATFILGIGDDVEADQTPVFNEELMDETEWEYWWDDE